MPDRWMDERNGDPRARDERDWRRTEREGRDGLRRYSEPRSFDEGEYEGDGGYEGGRDAVFGARSGDQRERAGYGADRGWQDPDYGGVSPQMRRGGYGAYGGQGVGRTRGRYAGYGRDGGRFYGDDARETIYREEYGATDFGYRAPRRDRDPGYSPTRANYHAYGYGEPGFDFGYDPQMLREMRWPASGGTGGYDYERGYGDGGRGERTERTERFERAGRGAGDFLHRAGEKVANWFAGGAEARAYDPDFDRPQARGLGPKGYKRSDERISEDAHERLTDDPWLDATDIALAVSAGEVTLSGTVTSREAKHRAERIVEYVGGVTHVQNNLRIERGDRPVAEPPTAPSETTHEGLPRRDESGANGAAARKT